MQFDIVANDKASGAMQKAEKSMGTFAQNMVGKFTMVAAKAALVVATVNRMYNVIKEAGDISDQAAKLGLSVESFQRLSFASDQYGASIEQVAMALKDVNKLLDEAATKGGPKADILKALGFSQQEIADRAISAEQVFARVAEAIKEARSEEEKFAAVSRIVGDRVAQSMIPILADFDKFKAKAGEIKVVTGENARAFDSLTDKAGAAMTTLKNQAINAAGALAMKLGIIKPEEIAPVPERSAEEKDAARRRLDALLAAEAKKAAPRESGMAVTSLQQIGGGVARGPSALENYAERTAIATETLASKATEPPAPDTGSTNFTAEGDDGETL